MAYDVIRLEADVRFYKTLYEKAEDSKSYIIGMLNVEQDLNKELLEKLFIITGVNVTTGTAIKDYKPVGGRTSLRKKVSSFESESYKKTVKTD